MKILALSNLYPPDFLGGYELGCAQMVDALRRRGHDVQVLTAAPRSPVPRQPHVHRRFELMDEWNLNALGSRALVRELNNVKSRFVNPFNVFILNEFVSEFRPEVVFLSHIGGLGGLSLVLALQYLRVPWLWHLGDCVPRLLCSRLGETVAPIAEEFSRQVRGHYIVVSQQLLREIEEGGVALADRVDLIPYWITGERPPERTDFYRTGQTLRIMYAGQVSVQKGADILIEAAGLLRDQGRSDFRIDVFGKVVDPAIPALVRRLGLADVVELRGVVPQAELLGLYSGYDVFAFPTWEREPFGLVPLEAVARGCVPLITRRCGVAEWLVHGVHCLKAGRSAAAFSDALAGVLSGAVALDPIARRGAVAAWRDFHIDAILPRVERALHEAAGRSRGDGIAAGGAGEAYRLARMAEQLAQALIQDELAA